MDRPRSGSCQSGRTVAVVGRGIVGRFQRDIARTVGDERPVRRLRLPIVGGGSGEGRGLVRRCSDGDSVVLMVMCRHWSVDFRSQRDSALVTREQQRAAVPPSLAKLSISLMTLHGKK